MPIHLKQYRCKTTDTKVPITEVTQTASGMGSSERFEVVVQRTCSQWQHCQQFERCQLDSED